MTTKEYEGSSLRLKAREAAGSDQARLRAVEDPLRAALFLATTAGGPPSAAKGFAKFYGEYQGARVSEDVAREARAALWRPEAAAGVSGFNQTVFLYLAKMPEKNNVQGGKGLAALGEVLGDAMRDHARVFRGDGSELVFRLNDGTMVSEREFVAEKTLNLAMEGLRNTAGYCATSHKAGSYS